MASVNDEQKMSKINKSLLIICVSVSAIFAYSFCDRQFKKSNIQEEWPLVEMASLTKDDQILLEKIVSQPFHYLDRGKQSFVFESQDKKVVLKFFDKRCLNSGKFPFIFNIKKKRCAKKIEQLFEGYRVAQEYDAGNTGLLYLQLVPDSSYSVKVDLIDRFGIKHVIDLSEVPFVVQEKATPLRNLISKQLNKGNVEEAKKKLFRMVSLYIDEYRRGIMDLDHNFMYNTGFVGENPIRIDLGRLKLNEEIKNPQCYRQDLNKVFIQRLGKWLESHYPKYKDEILNDMQSYLQKNLPAEYCTLH